MSRDTVRMPILKRLAEQSMSDATFRQEAAADLDGALDRYGYDLNDRERELVVSFRETLADAGVDLFLKDEIDLETLFDDASPDDLDAFLDANRKR